MRSEEDVAALWVVDDDGTGSNKERRAGKREGGGKAGRLGGGLVGMTEEGIEGRGKTFVDTYEEGTWVVWYLVLSSANDFGKGATGTPSFLTTLR